MAGRQTAELGGYRRERGRGPASAPRGPGRAGPSRPPPYARPASPPAAAPRPAAIDALACEVRACARAGMHAHACVPACAPACLPACVDECMSACGRACVRACVHECVRAVIRDGGWLEVATGAAEAWTSRRGSVHRPEMQEEGRGTRRTRGAGGTRHEVGYACSSV